MGLKWVGVSPGNSVGEEPVCLPACLFDGMIVTDMRAGVSRQKEWQGCTVAG